MVKRSVVASGVNVRPYLVVPRRIHFGTKGEILCKRAPATHKDPSRIPLESFSLAPASLPLTVHLKLCTAATSYALSAIFEAIVIVIDLFLKGCA